jgi:hypothetical protein
MKVKNSISLTKTKHVDEPNVVHAQNNDEDVAANTTGDGVAA